MKIVSGAGNIPISRESLETHYRDIEIGERRRHDETFLPLTASGRAYIYAFLFGVPSDFPTDRPKTIIFDP